MYNTIKLYCAVEHTATVYIIVRYKTIVMMRKSMSENSCLVIKFRFSVLTDNEKLCISISHENHSHLLVLLSLSFLSYVRSISCDMNAP